MSAQIPLTHGGIAPIQGLLPSDALLGFSFRIQLLVSE